MTEELAMQTWRSQHMERYVKVFTYGDGWRVRLEIGNQGFHVGEEWETLQEAEWYRDMLCNALDALKNDSLPAKVIQSIERIIEGAEDGQDRLSIINELKGMLPFSSNQCGND